MREIKNKNHDHSDDDRPKKEQCSFFAPLHHTNYTSTMDFEWPEFKNDRERIKAFSKRYKDVPFEEIFGATTSIAVPEVPFIPTIGTIYKADLQISNKGTEIIGLAIKESVICRNNLGRFKNIPSYIQNADIKVVGIDKVRQTVTVDAVQPVFEKWINDVLQDKTQQYDVKRPNAITVHDLHLTKGGFIGKAEVPCLSNFVGEPYYVDAFIPGSQIVLNIEKDFTQWEGKTVDTFVSGCTIANPLQNKASLICSRKALLNFSGDLSKIELYNEYCSNSKKWQTFSKSILNGIITGVIHDSKRCGVFVEIPMLNITSMIKTAPDELVNYKAGNDVNVRFVDFEQMLAYDPTTGNTVHAEPYKIENGCLKSCILKPVLEFA